MKRNLELRRLEWREKSDPQRVVVASLTWYSISIDADAPSTCVP